MKGSGKQVLLRILYELSTHALPEPSLPDASGRLRAGLLLHGSTAEESFEHAARLKWCSESDEDGVRRQGAGTSGGVFVSDVYEDMIEMPGLSQHLVQRHPELTLEDVEACEWFMWLIISGVQMFSQLNVVEENGEIDVDTWVESVLKKYDNHFRDRGREPPR